MTIENTILVQHIRNPQSSGNDDKWIQPLRVATNGQIYLHGYLDDQNAVTSYNIKKGAIRGSSGNDNTAEDYKKREIEEKTIQGINIAEKTIQSINIAEGAITGDTYNSETQEWNSDGKIAKEAISARHLRDNCINENHLSKSVVELMIREHTETELEEMGWNELTNAPIDYIMNFNYS